MFFYQNTLQFREYYKKRLVLKWPFFSISRVCVFFFFFFFFYMQLILIARKQAFKVSSIPDNTLKKKLRRGASVTEQEMRQHRT